LTFLTVQESPSITTSLLVIEILVREELQFHNRSYPLKHLPSMIGNLLPLFSLRRADRNPCHKFAYKELSAIFLASSTTVRMILFNSDFQLISRHFSHCPRFSFDSMSKVS
jgi:hypothetical protein